MNSAKNVELPPWYGQWLSLGVQTDFKLYNLAKLTLTQHFLEKKNK